MKRLLVLLFAAQAGIALAASSGTTQEFPASPGQRLVLDLKIGGGVEVTGWSSDLLRVTWQSPPGVSAADIRVEPTQGGFAIKGESAKAGSSLASLAVIQVWVPQKFDVQVNTMGGNLQLTNLSGLVSGAIAAGDLTIEKLQGRAELTVLGSIRVTDSELDGSLTTENGDVTFKDVVGDVTGLSAHGAIKYENVRRRIDTRATGAGAGRERN